MQANVVQEAEVRVRNRFRRLLVEHADDECREALRDFGVAVAAKVQYLVVLVELRVDPNVGLAPVDVVVVGFLVLFQQRNVVAELDQVLVSVHPVVEERKLVDDLLRTIRDGVCVGHTGRG